MSLLTKLCCCIAVSCCTQNQHVLKLQKLYKTQHRVAAGTDAFSSRVVVLWPGLCGQQHQRGTGLQELVVAHRRVAEAAHVAGGRRCDQRRSEGAAQRRGGVHKDRTLAQELQETRLNRFPARCNK